LKHVISQKHSIDNPADFWFYHTPFAGKFMYAVLETGSKQYRVAAGDTLEIERLAVEAGKPVTFDRVLLVNRDGKVAVGAPTVSRRHRRGRRGGTQARREKTHVQDETPQGLS
jgi:ribosomal protein L21